MLFPYRWSLVVGRWSLVVGRWSLVVGRRSLVVIVGRCLIIVGVGRQHGLDKFNHNPPAASPRQTTNDQRPTSVYLPSASFIRAPMSAGLLTTCTPAAVSASIFSAAVP